MTAAARRPRSRPRPAAALSSAVLLGVLLSGCAQPEPEPETPEMAEPPNREIDEPRLVAGAQLPVWARSAACDEPRPAPDEDGLRIPAPVPDEEHVVFFVPAVEQTLCGMPGVSAASLSGSYTEDGGRDGEAELDLLFGPGVAPEQMEAAWSTGTGEGEARLEDAGLDLADSTLMLDDGSLITGPSSDPAGPAAASIPQAIALLADLRAASPLPPEETAPAAESAAPEEPEDEDPVPRWRIETGRSLDVTTVYSDDLSAEGAPDRMAEALEAAQKVSAPEGAPRTDAVSVVDGRMQLTVDQAHLDRVSQDLAADLHALGQVPDLEATARLETGDDGRPVLSVRSQRLPEYSHPSYQEAAEDLEVSAAAAGLVLDHRLDGERLPLEEE